MQDIPNFFLMTLRIFFWSNFLGRPWTVVNVLRPLRSVSLCQHHAISFMIGDSSYVEYGCGCNSGFASLPQCRRRPPRRGLWAKVVSYNSQIKRIRRGTPNWLGKHCRPAENKPILTETRIHCACEGRRRLIVVAVTWCGKSTRNEGSLTKGFEVLDS